MEGKRGAIELSITTIVVVVIGITLLVLGLTFVYNIFNDIGEQQKRLGTYTDEQIRDIFAESDQSLNFPTTDFSVEIGEIFNLDMVIKNKVEGVTGSDRCNFKLEIIESDTTDNVDPANWFSFSQDASNIPIGVDPPIKLRGQIRPTRSNAALGTYLMTVKLTGEKPCGSEAGSGVFDVDKIPITIRVV